MESNLPLNAASLLLSALPLVMITVVILHLRWSLLKASVFTCIAAVILAVTYFGVEAGLMAAMIGKGFAFSFYIGIILVTAIFLYNLLTELGIMESMGQRLLFLKDRPLLQVLFLAWCFSGFIEGFIGFGIPVVLVSPFLIIGGLSAFQAVALTLVGHAWAVTYGTLGVALYTLSLSSRIPVSELSYALAAQFTLMFTVTGFAVAHLYNGWKAVREGAISILAAGISAGTMFFLCAAVNITQLSAVLGGLFAAGVLLIVDRVKRGKKPAVLSKHAAVAKYSAVDTFTPYAFLCIIALLFQYGPIKAALDTIGFAFSFPQSQTVLGYVVPAEPSFIRISFRHPGFVIALTAFFTYYLYRCRGLCRPIFPAAVFRQTLKMSVTSLGTLLILVTIAMIMNNSGMTTILALGVSRAAGPVYPILAPFFGLLGTFLTGSNTNSNLLFGLFQHQAALNLGYGPTLLVAAHTAAASITSSIAPAKIILATSAIGNHGAEQSLLARNLWYCLILTIAAGVAAIIFSFL